MNQQKDTQSFKLPNCEETESAVLGALLCESSAIHEVSTLLTPEIFFRPDYAAMYAAIEAIHNRGERPDMILVLNELQRRGTLETAGGAANIANVASRIGSSVNVFEHACYLHQLYLSRRLVLAGHLISKNAADLSKDVDDSIAESLQAIEQISDDAIKNANTFDLRQSTHVSLSRYQERKENAKNGLKTAITTGLGKLDDVLGGLARTQLIILASRPAMGKTSFLLNTALSAAKNGIAVVVFSLEMSHTALTDRMIISEGRLNADHYRRAYLNPNEETVMCNSADYLSALPITIDDTANISMQQIKARAKNLKRKGKCDLVLIDYLQLIDMRSSNRTYNREQEVSMCSRAAKCMAKDLDIPVMLLSQLSRKCEDRADKTPLLSDLRESGAIEQDADVVLFIHRPEYYDGSAEKGVGVIRIAKQRDGKTGDIKFKYNESITVISDYDSNPF